ncbi:MAG: translation elongation factor Ts [Pseudomonadota bacterium]
MNITASLVKSLRDRTGAGMMECKKALTETGGDIEAAIEHMRKSGMAKADKKAGRIAAEGRIVIARDGARAAIVEVNSETDFVAKDDNFAKFSDDVGRLALEAGSDDLTALMATDAGDGQTLDEARRALIAKIGENVSVRRVQSLEADGPLGAYSHGARIGVLVALSGGDEELARDVAMHVAATNPQYLSADHVPAEALEKERGILTEQALQEGKPEHIVEKMVEGRVRKHLAEITLLGQPFVKDPDVTVGKLVEGAKASVAGYVRYEVGEGIEKKQENFADEVMKQVRDSQ